jgi:hypothetical protein
VCACPTRATALPGTPPPSRRRRARPGAGPRLFVADLDNNGASDLLVSSADGRADVLLADGRGRFAPPTAAAPALRATDVADADGDGVLDLLGVNAAGAPTRAAGKGTRGYHYLVLRPRAKETTGDQRINSFGIGGVIQARAGLLLQTQPVERPVVHFGLGTRTEADVARIVWPNGSVRGEFALQGDRSLLAEQRLKGSCPFLFAWDGARFGFVTDCIWRSPLGLRINAQTTAGVAMTSDWVKIRGDQLAPRSGVYDLRVTAELWETHFFDHLGLMTVDHPEGTEVWVDERFAFPPPPLAVIATETPRPVARAVADDGTELTAAVAERDGRHADHFGRGRYQGVTRDHWLEVDLGGAGAPGPLYLIAHGWIHPTDSSINVALGQNPSAAPPSGLSIEVPDRTAPGGWRKAKDGLGFPTGKVKTVVLDLSGLWKPGEPRRLRLRTNLEIFWDQITWAHGAPSATIKTRKLAVDTAGLRPRGFSHVEAADRSSPELPRDYGARAATTQQRWRDLEGYYTRFGDVRELLGGIDDRYVIMNAGDEMRLTFLAPGGAASPPAGWKRDYVLIGDGWVKDGDFNTTFSKTVLPLPTHDRADYETPPTELEDDPVYRRHADDWRDFHTRYVAPASFQNALRPRRRD